MAVFGKDLPDNTTRCIVVLDITHPCILRRMRKTRPLEENVLKGVSHDLCTTEDFRACRIILPQLFVPVKEFVKLRILSDIRKNREALRCQTLTDACLVC